MYKTLRLTGICIFESSLFSFRDHLKKKNISRANWSKLKYLNMLKIQDER